MKKLFTILFFAISLQVVNHGLMAQGNTVKDIDGNVYHTVKIGKQIWTKENLKTTHYQNGAPITEIEDKATWENTDKTRTPAWCVYQSNNKNSTILSSYFENEDIQHDPMFGKTKEENEATYGKLYNWFAASDPRNVCPVGWHVPTDDEYEVLSSYLGGDSVSGGHMKATTLWNPPNVAADNSSGFSAIAAGCRYYTGVYQFIGNIALFWTSTGDSLGGAWNYDLYGNKAYVQHNYYHQEGAFSIRCLKN